MSRALPPLDLHAHVDVGVAPRELEGLGAVVFAATRSPDEADRALRRDDAVTVWGAGCHPGLASAQEAFDRDRFSDLLDRTAYVSEVGLDGGSNAPLEKQIEVFTAILDLVAAKPRIVSVHTKRATRAALELIEDSRIRGVVLHWWLGSAAETKRALELGCRFSVNPSMDIKRLEADGVPLELLLPETDHPSGNRKSASIRQPGWTAEVEQAAAGIYGLQVGRLRQRFWATFAQLVAEVDVASLLPKVVQAMVAHAEITEPD